MCYLYFFCLRCCSLIFIFSLIRTLDYPDFLLRSRRVRIIEVRLYTEMLINDKPIKFQIDCGSSINILTKDVVDNYDLAPTTKTLIVENITEVMPLDVHCKNHYRESSKPQEVICKVCRSDGKTNPFIRRKSRTTQEASDDTLE